MVRSLPTSWLTSASGRPMTNVALTLRSAAAIGDLPGTGYVRPSFSHIPGSVLRGAIASGWLKAGRPIDATFLSAFERDVVWGPLFVPGSEPQPLSHWVHKYGSKQTCPAFWDEASEGVPEGRVCPECHDPVEPSKGQLSGVQRSLDTHVQLAEGRAVAGALFARERLSRGQTFVGTVVPLNETGESSLAEVMLTAGCGTDGSVGRIWVGGRRSTDGGRADVACTNGARSIPRIDGPRLVVSLLSPGIFVDDYGFPTDVPRSDELTDVLGVQAAVVRSWVRWTTIGGWHAAARLPKPAERAAVAGSVYTIECDTTPAAERVQDLLDRGLGLRRVEGFGVLRTMPEKSRGYREISAAVVPLRGLSAQVLRQVRTILSEAQEAVRSGDRPNWGLVATLSASSSVPPHIAEAARFLMSLSAVDELAVADRVLVEMQ